MNARRNVANYNTPIIIETLDTESSEPPETAEWKMAGKDWAAFTRERPSEKIELDQIVSTTAAYYICRWSPMWRELSKFHGRIRIKCQDYTWTVHAIHDIELRHREAITLVDRTTGDGAGGAL